MSCSGSPTHKTCWEFKYWIKPAECPVWLDLFCADNWRVCVILVMAKLELWLAFLLYSVFPVWDTQNALAWVTVSSKTWCEFVSFSFSGSKKFTEVEELFMLTKADELVDEFVPVKLSWVYKNEEKLQWMYRKYMCLRQRWRLEWGCTSLFYFQEESYSLTWLNASNLHLRLPVPNNCQLHWPTNNCPKCAFHCKINLLLALDCTPEVWRPNLLADACCHKKSNETVGCRLFCDSGIHLLNMLHFETSMKLRTGILHVYRWVLNFNHVAVSQLNKSYNDEQWSSPSKEDEREKKEREWKKKFTNLP